MTTEQPRFGSVFNKSPEGDPFSEEARVRIDNQEDIESQSEQARHQTAIEIANVRNRPTTFTSAEASDDSSGNSLSQLSSSVTLPNSPPRTSGNGEAMFGRLDQRDQVPAIENNASTAVRFDNRLNANNGDRIKTIRETRAENAQRENDAAQRITTSLPENKREAIAQLLTEDLGGGETRLTTWGKKVIEIEAIKDTDPEKYREQKDGLLAEIGGATGVDAQIIYEGLKRENNTIQTVNKTETFVRIAEKNNGAYLQDVIAAYKSDDPAALEALAQKIADETGDKSLLERVREQNRISRLNDKLNQQRAQETAAGILKPIGPNSFSPETQKLFADIEAVGNGNEFLETLKSNVIDQTPDGVFTSFLGAPVFIPYGNLNGARIDGAPVPSFTSEEFQRTVIDRETNLTRTFRNTAEREAFVEGLLGDKQLEDNRLLSESDVRRLSGIVQSLNLDTPDGKRLIREIGAYPLPQNEFKLDLVAVQLDMWGVGGGDGVGDPTTVDDVIKWWRHQEYMWQNGGKPFGTPDLMLLYQLASYNDDGSPMKTPDLRAA